MKKEKFYITTSIAYANAGPHLGHVLEYVQADVLARAHRLAGDDVFFLTGMDEHGRKVAQTAEREGASPPQFVDGVAEQFRGLKNPLSLSYDDFIRTSDQVRHFPSVRAVWEQLVAKGDIYKKEYEGLYCVGCEAFLPSKEIIDETCRIHGKKLESIREENYFFRLSNYAKEIESSIKNDALIIVPEGKKNEMLRFLEEGLEDISFSRPRKDLAWGVPVPGDDTQTIYVWADALVNYISALGYSEGQMANSKWHAADRMRYWPADIHCIGKDIVKFHALYWPGMLLALGLPLPRTLLVHGFITADGHKMSKSLGNVVDPFTLIARYGGEAVRYFLLREVSPHDDGDFTEEKFRERYNADLANGIGNFSARVLTLAQGNLKLKDQKSKLQLKIQNKEIEEKIIETKKLVEERVGEFKFNEALQSIWDLIRFGDRYVNEHKPWETKDKEVVGNLVIILREIGLLLQPFLPGTAEKILGAIERGEKLPPLFPRV